LTSLFSWDPLSSYYRILDHFIRVTV
jgi:hypothetical protein